MAQQTLDRFGRIDVLINNAAIFATIPMNRGRIEEISSEEWDKLMAVNLKGIFYCSRAVLPAMARAKDRQNHQHRVRHCVWRQPWPHSLRHVQGGHNRFFTRTLAREVGDDNIQVTCWRPATRCREGKSPPKRCSASANHHRPSLAEARAGAPGCCRSYVVPGLTAKRFHHWPDHQCRRWHFIQMKRRMECWSME